MLVERILVTGASRGIGRELVRRLLETDRAVIAICRDRHSADGLEASFAQFADGQLTTISADLAQSSAASIVERELTGVDQLDGLINCAGVNRGSGAIHDEATRSLDDLEANAINAMFQVNATTPLLLIATLRGRLGRAGAAKVINLTSSRATPGPGEGGKYGYRASKAALNIFTRCAAADLSQSGVIVVGIDPGWVRTAMGGDDAPRAADDAAAAIIRLFDQFTLEQTGRLFTCDGEELPW